MYLEHFGLHEFPFSLAPDPRYLYLSAQHREALAHLLYGVQHEGGFVQLTGEVGTGKTTVCRCFLEQLPQGTRAAVVLNPALTAEELLAAICDEFEIARPAGPASLKSSLDAINRFLLDAHAAGERAVLVVDEAQNLDAAVLEQLRLLTNLETSRHKLLQIILMGQPELRATLARPDLRQLAQRITARFHIRPLTQEETAAYVRHRLGVAGCHAEIFPPGVVRRIRGLSRGVPRLVNILCDRALLGAYVQGKHRVDRATLEQAAREVAGKSRWQALRRPLVLTAGGCAIVAAAWLALAGLRAPDPAPQSGAAAPASSPAGPAAPQPPAVAPASAAPAAPPRPPAAPAKASAVSPPASREGSAPTGGAAGVVAPVVRAVPAAGTGGAAVASRPAAEGQPAPDAPPRPVAAAGAPAAVAPSLRALMEAPGAQREEEAWRWLYRLWGIRARDGESGCTQALLHGLACLRGAGGLTQLRALDRPAIVRVHDAAGAPRWLVLERLHGGEATLSVGGARTTVAAAALDGLGIREFALLWRQPADGTAGPAVLLSLDSEPAPGTPTLGAPGEGR